MTSSDGVARARALVRDLPVLHHRAAGSHSGGLNPQIGDVLIDQISQLTAPTIIETGAGASSLLFLELEAEHVISIAPDDDLGERIAAEIEQRGLDADRYRFVHDRSEVALPRLAHDEELSCQVGFIDGNHGWPAVFVDFCYLNNMLTRDGLMVIDDIHLHSCAQLVLLLRHQDDHFELVDITGKQAMFRKVRHSQWMPDFRQEPYIVANTVDHLRGYKGAD